MALIEQETCAAESVATGGRAPRLPRPPRVMLGRTPVDRITMEYAAILVTEALLHPAKEPPLLIVGPNASLVTMAEGDASFARAMQAADLAVPDGMSVVWALGRLGAPIPERVTGGDLMERLCADAARFGFRVFFLGGLPGAAVIAAHNLTERYPGLNICGTCCPPPGFEDDPAWPVRIEKEIAEARPDLLCVAFGAPKQEIWMLEHRSRVRVGAMLSVGAAFDTQAGLRRRAPGWMQRAGLEWLFRLLMEPRRLGRRYLIGNTQFVLLVMRLWRVQKRQAVRRGIDEFAARVRAIAGDWGER